ncbi:MAG: nitrous oxide reductase accessory protein NosL [Phycisphaerales bacterium]|nr:nitrous oxide reductase accessory protein NosL [Phycisphaerales bacterium]
MSIVRMVALGSIAAVFAMPGCGSDTNDGPPSVRYGDSICAECGMIVSDERFTTATIIEGDRGSEPLIFDDFNCQMIFESKHTDLTIVDRWSHDHGTNEWIRMDDAWFVKSNKLHTPMASNIASFKAKSDADTFAKTLNGQVSDYHELQQPD